jgi:pimeloyl-ACP methyl ester carboxylesterase
VSDNPRVQPETRYARSGDVSIAYQVTGDGRFDVVHVPAFLSHVELSWEVPGMAHFERRMASFCRSIRLDKRGTGMSDRVSGAPTLETRMDDVRAVMDAVGCERAALIGASEGGPMSILFAATYPDRVWTLVLVGSYARVLWAPDYPYGYPEEEYRRFLDGIERDSGTRGGGRHSCAEPCAECRRREQARARDVDPAEREPGREKRPRPHEHGDRRSRRAALRPRSHADP